ncbi:MAG TPA: hypothetical protein VG755_21430 [Nannocystaceae bacterium]|nr:hypothetical protein [Nannocystaceae bacterium]
MTKRRSSTTPPALPAIGSRVRIPLAVGSIVATVIEHRGPLGGDGREVIRVRYRFAHSNETVDTERLVDEVKPLRRSQRSAGRVRS